MLEMHKVTNILSNKLSETEQNLKEKNLEINQKYKAITDLQGELKDYRTKLNNAELKIEELTMDIREKKTQLSDFIKELIEIRQKLEELDHSFK